MVTASDLLPGAVVTIDGLLTVRASFLSAQRWNGWACPYLDRAAVESLARQITAAPERYGMGGMTLDGDRLTITHPEYPDEPETDGGLTIDGVRYWTPGAWSWVWSEWPEVDGHRITDTPEGVIVCERCGLPAAEAYGVDCEQEAGR